ncbi:MAG: uroporphyrinogen decarboxylase [Polyangiales bacterium]
MSTFLRALRREPTEYTPIWLMRQAGRYQPEYRAIRSKVSFLELCQRSDLAAEVTVLAVEQLGVDAAIIFADILLILEPLRIGFEFTKDDGPRILAPVRTAAQVDAVAESIDVQASLGYVMESIRLAKKDLKVPLIGFAAAPFTLASYAIEGGGSKNYYATKKLMSSDPGLWHALMAKLSRATAAYLNAQIAAGADAVQLFDSWIGCLSPEDYAVYVQPHVKSIFDALDRSVPAIHFGTGNPSLYPLMKAAGGDVIGVDWRVSLDTAWSTVGSDVGIMGNLDPAYLLTSVDAMKAKATEILRNAGGRPGHVFNLGHGIMPEASVDQVKALVAHVHETSAALKKG